jgi:uncharacterized membrane protein YhaH (DUF805 family)
MAFRFQKRIKILPGVRLNISKSGLSTTLGVRGASVNVGKRGVYGNAGLPGTGLSYRQRLDTPKAKTVSPPRREPRLTTPPQSDTDVHRRDDPALPDTGYVDQQDLHIWNGYFTAGLRRKRAGFAKATLALVVMTALVLAMLGGMLPAPDEPSVTGSTAQNLAMIAVVVLGLLQSILIVQRARDIGLPGWLVMIGFWLIAVFFPVGGLITFAALLLVPSRNSQ